MIGVIFRSAEKTTSFIEIQKEVIYMILLTVLIIIAIILAIVAITFLSIGGALFTIIFGDLIVCIAIIVLIIRCLRRRKKRR